MKKLVLALGLLLLPSLAWAQNPTCPTRPLGDNSNACASDQFVQNQIAASTAIIFTPTTYGAKCDGVADDTTAFHNLATALDAVTGIPTVEMPVGGNCLIYNSGQSVATALVQVQSLTLTGLRVHGNGATFTVGHTFLSGESLVLFNVVGNGNVVVDGVNVVQTTPINPATPGLCPAGTVIINAISNSHDIWLTNSSLIGGFTPVTASNTTSIHLEGIRVTNSCYGINLLSGVSGLWVTNYVTDGVDRDIFLKGVTKWNISLTSVNVRSNAVLLSADQNNAVLSDGHLDYKVLARTAAASAPASYITIGDSLACACTGAIFRNLVFNLDIDVSGDNATVPAITFIKSTAASLGLVFENIKFGGKISGALANAGNLVDLFVAADSPWTGETASNISIENLLVTGSATPGFRIDYGAINTVSNGNLAIRNLWFPGNYTAVNGGNEDSLLACTNGTWANKNCIWMPSYGGTGLYRPTANSLLQTNVAGSTVHPFTLITAATAGNIPVDQGAGSQWLSKAISGDAALAASGALTVSKIGGQAVTLGGAFTMSGAFAFTGTLTNTTSVTFPTSGTLATTAGTVASFSAGTTGFTPNSATTGAVTLAGTLVVANGGTNCAVASITCFNNITGFSAASTTGTTSTNLVFSGAPTLTGAVQFTGVSPSAINITASNPAANEGLTITNTSSTGNASTLFANDGGLIGGFFVVGSGGSAYGGANTMNVINLAAAGLGLGANNGLKAFISSAGGFFVGTTSTDAGASNIQAAGTIRGNTGFSANGTAGVSTTCTETVGNTITFTFGLLTAKGANCT